MLLQKSLQRTLGRGGSESAKFGYVLLLLGVFCVSSAASKKYNSTAATSSSSFYPKDSSSTSYASSVVSFSQAKNASTNADAATSASNTNSFSVVGTGRQARDSTSSYGAPAAGGGGGGGGGGYGAPGSSGGYANPQYAIPPIIMQHGGGGWGMTSGMTSGMGWGMDDDDDGGGDGLKGLIGLLGLLGLKPLKAVKALKGLGLLALSPILLPLLPLLPILLLAPLLLPLLLLLFLPVPVISVPGRRRKRDVSGHEKVQTSKTLLQETIDDIMSQIPADFAHLRWKDVDQCMDKFICDTGMMVSRVAPSMATPAAWLLGKLWPEPLQSKVETFRKVTEMMKHKKSYNYLQDAKSRNSFYYSYNLHPAKHSSGICAVNYKCRVKKLENLFHNLVVQQTEKLKEKLIERIPPGEMSPATIFRALLT